MLLNFLISSAFAYNTSCYVDFTTKNHKDYVVVECGNRKQEVEIDEKDINEGNVEGIVRHVTKQLRSQRSVSN